MNERYDKLVLSIPHASLQDWHHGWNDVCTLFEHVKQWTDWHTDIVFTPHGKAAANVSTHVFDHSRFCVDVERLIDDALEAEGQGIVYERFEQVYRGQVNRERLMSIRENYLETLCQQLATVKGGQAMLVDCHSFPSMLAPDVDVCIGCNDDWSRPAQHTLDVVGLVFERNGYRVAYNKPYSNSLTPWDKPCYHSMMIELSKRTYMNESTLTLNNNAMNHMTQTINEVYLQLLK